MSLESAPAPAPHLTVDILGLCPSVRDEVCVSVQVYGGRTCYVIEDRLRSKFYRLGLAEYTFVSLLDGQTTIAEAMGRTAEVCGSEGLEEREIATLCKWLLECSLITTEQSSSESRLEEGRAKQRARKVLGNANPMLQKIPLCNPMPVLRHLDPLATTVFGVFGFAIWILAVGFATFALWGSWDEFSAAGIHVLARENWLVLLATWLGLKLVHEAGHALACRRYGGHVRESGIVLILFAPMPYVDVTDAWKIDGKWQRVMISAAGMYAEIFCAAIAALVWTSSFDPFVRQHAMNVIVTATVMTLLVNANPLMRFDGYYMLIDALELPNLATHGRQWLAAATRRHFMGMDVRNPDRAEGSPAVVATYAIASLVWRWIVCVSLVLSAAVLMHGAGTAIAIIAIGLWVGLPCCRWIRMLMENRLVRYRRMACITAVAAGTLWMCWSVVPWYSRGTVPLVVDYHHPHEVRIGADGFLDRLTVSVGDVVSRGQILARLSNRELELEYQDLLLDLETSEARYRGFVTDESIAAAAVEQQVQASLRSRLTELERQLGGLVVCSPADGVIARCDVESREGAFIHRGERLFLIGSPGSEKMIGLVDQADVDAFRRGQGQRVDVRLWGMGERPIAGRIDRVLPRAEVSLPHAALGADAGGPLPVRLNPQATNDSDAMQLIAPRFPVLIDLVGGEIDHVMPGQTGYARLVYRDGTLGRAVRDSLADWIEDKRAMLTMHR
ncbi:Peptidase family M50 [Stieleria neptunia]|uniref:Peptidase family M50 n=1 Tax=Stieleria neptunia TaxID=2527979 RepID=A0A518I407_9BACT|nr:HlyD family efflux transporter periplasmic adaptor subunit [Stieleria neptunia]QDV47832.1 Peptidase family M50 [Stieleria neptunia]